ncbi:MAG: class I SAM-dependent methyltransferase [Elusimicrobiota bacterium]
MMSDLPRIYDAAFFAEWGRANEKYVDSARAITDALHGLYQPKRLIDLGAGCGVYSHYFAAKGTEVVTVDGVVPDQEHSYPLTFQVRDLTAPFDNPWGRFDLALCLEVAEHIPEELSGAFLDNIIRFSDRLILSAAQPGQEGHHHVNTQPKRYWVARLAEKGFAYNRRETGRVQTALAEAKDIYRWMADPISVYDQVKTPARPGDRLPFAVAPR